MGEADLGRFGVVGLGIMGANLARNMARHGAEVVGYDRTPGRGAGLVARHGDEGSLVATESLTELAAVLPVPRRILVMVPAGAPVDAVVGELAPVLAAGDIVIDGGNSFYVDTERRAAGLADRGLHLIGMGVSGGEEGALNGPSLMPGGPREAYDAVAPVLLCMAAVSDAGPCVTYVGPGGSGHFVKMVHNGIEYGDMQLICEVYDVLRRGMGLSAGALAATFGAWNQGDLASYLIEITAEIAAFPDDQGGEGPLVDRILDAAGQKGTGRWTSEAALSLGVATPTLAAAVDARVLSSMAVERAAATAHYPRPEAPPPGDGLVSDVGDALYAAKVCSYAQGFSLLRAASAELSFGLDLAELARIWKGGCIIRARVLDVIRAAFAEAPELPSLLLAPTIAEAVGARLPAWRRVVAFAVGAGIPVPALSSALAYLDTLASERLPAGLLQAQRDFFGAHTYRRVDREGTFHTEWR
jgi:6-phosphogluconate dehydrogenase